MRVSALVLLGLVLLAGASADSSDLANGVFIVHGPASIQYTSDPPSGSWGLLADGIYACPRGEEEDGGGEADGDIAEDDDAVEEDDGALAHSIMVLPPSINVADSSWTFLTFGPDEAGITGLTLYLDDLMVPPNFIERTTPESRLWTFSLVRPGVVGEVAIDLTFETGPSIVVPVEVFARPPARGERLHEGQVGVKTAPGAMGYEPGARSQLLSELGRGSPELLEALRGIGATAITKMWPDVSEERDAYPPGHPMRGPDWLPDWARTAYIVHLNPRHSMRAIAAILETQPSITSAYAREMLTSY